MLLKPNVGRALSAVGAIVLVLALFMVWYHVDRSSNDSTTGWQTFTHLRWVILGGSLLVLISALIPQVRLVLIGRTLLGLVLAALVARRIIDPPHLSVAVSSQVGVFVGVLGGLCVAIGGLVDSGRHVIEVYPDLVPGPVAQLGRGSRALDSSRDQR